MQIPEIWTTVLNLIRKDYPGAIIAGGALRDLYSDTEIKDVDIFIPVDGCAPRRPHEETWSMATFAVCSAFAAAYPLTELKIKFDLYTSISDDEAPDVRDRVLYAICTFELGGYTFELIVARREEASIRGFDINICQIQYDGTEVLATDRFLLGMKFKVIEVCNFNRSDRQRARINRMLSKYPTFILAEYKCLSME